MKRSVGLCLTVAGITLATSGQATLDVYSSSGVPSLPIMGSKYLSFDNFPKVFRGIPGIDRIELNNIQHVVGLSLPGEWLGDTWVENFNSDFTGHGDVYLPGGGHDGGPASGHFVSTVKVDGLASGSPPYPVPPTYPANQELDTEISFSFIATVHATGGDQQIFIRTDPNKKSAGKTEIKDLAPGLYRISSFFNVYAQISSPDWGGLWFDGDGPIRMELVPEPTTTFAGVAMLVLLGWSSRRARRP